VGDAKREAVDEITEAIACCVEGMKQLGRRRPRRRSRVVVVRIKLA
jgi:predicted RNase H-like HicB family nuclease